MEQFLSSPFTPWVRVEGESPTPTHVVTDERRPVRVANLEKIIVHHRVNGRACEHAITHDVSPYAAEP